MEEKTIPLVIYKGEERIVIGTSTIRSDGSFEVKIDDQRLADQYLPRIKIGELSISSGSPSERFLRDTGWPIVDGIMSGLASEMPTARSIQNVVANALARRYGRQPTNGEVHQFIYGDDEVRTRIWNAELPDPDEET